MDIKKNWSKIVLAVLAVIGAVVFLVAMLDKIDHKAQFAAVCYDVMGLVFFLGTAAYLVCKMFEVEPAKHIMFVVGAINLILVCIFLFGTVVDVPALGFKATGLEVIFGKQVPVALQQIVHTGIAATATQIGFAICAAMFPLVRGIQKTFFAADAQ